MSKNVSLNLLPSGVTIHAPEGSRLQDMLFQHGVEFPCGGHGRCKGCRIRVLKGHLPIHAEERDRLSETDLAAGWRMACLARADTDLVLELAQWETAILADDSKFDFTPRTGYGVAVDIGTTTIVAQLVDLATANVLGVVTGLNEQARHGADIMSRIEFAVAEKGQKTLEQMIRNQVHGIVRELLAAPAGQIQLSHIMLVGNTVMHHLFSGIDVEPLSHYPFEPTLPGQQVFSCSDLNWEIPGNPGITFLPCAGGFVGSDVLAGVVAVGMHKSTRLSALMDLGTNGEIVVGTADRMVCASTAAGPAFEGARISMGMRAATGAISGVTAENGRLECRVLGGVPARGVCGSGLVDGVAAALHTGMVRPNGRLANGESLMLQAPVALTQWDIRELQMAKGAIAAGLRILVQEFGAELKDLQTVYLAGAFGNYIDLTSGARIGLLNVPIDRVRPSGNSALLGAKLALFDEKSFEPDRLLRRLRHISLNELPAFQDIYAEEMLFPMSEIR